MTEEYLVYGGFSFCGVNIAKYGLSYAPEIEDTYVYAPAETQSHIETFEGHNGGYYYGSWLEPKEFTLRCYFENQHINRGIMTQIFDLFKVGRSGKLIFDKRPWCYYNAIVTEKVDVSTLTNYQNGLITIHMKALYPYARSDITTNLRTDKYHNEIMKNSAAFDKEGMEFPSEYTNITAQKTLLLCNQGTERAALGFSIAGNAGAGVIIANNTTGQYCRMVAFSKAVTTDVNKVVKVDPINGKTVLTGASGTSLAFMFHDSGFLNLESSFPALRDIYVEYYGGVGIHVQNILHENVVGKYIFAAGKWRKIVEQPDKHTIKVQASDTISTTGYERTMIIILNEIVITPVSTMEITSLKFMYKPTYA